LEGYHYHSLVDAAGEQLYLKLSERESERVVAISVRKGAYQDNCPIPLPIEPLVMETQIVCLFHVVIPTTVLESYNHDKGIIDLHLVNKVENYIATVRLLGKTDYHPTSKLTLVINKNQRILVTTYNTKYGNLFLKLEDAVKKRTGRKKTPYYQ
jgi:poly(ribitol-phosphate) beta-N-acetylglucosaminyltransferase